MRVPDCLILSILLIPAVPRGGAEASDFDGTVIRGLLQVEFEYADDPSGR
jgi:hypothetical protein